MRKSTTVWVLAASFGFAHAAVAGFYLEHEAVLHHPQSQKNVRVVLKSWQQGSKTKRVSPLQNETLIIDSQKGEVVGIDEKKRTYWRIPAQRYRAFAANALGVFGIKPTTEGAIQVPTPMFVPTGQHAEIAGRRAQEFRIAGDYPAGMQTHIWVSAEVPLSPQAWSMQMQMALGAPDHPSYRALFAQWAALPGYPVQTVTTIQSTAGTAVSSETLMTVRAEEVPEVTFQIPAGFQQVDAPFINLEKNEIPAKRSPPVGIDAPL